VCDDHQMHRDFLITLYMCISITNTYNSKIYLINLKLRTQSLWSNIMQPMTRDIMLANVASTGTVKAALSIWVSPHLKYVLFHYMSCCWLKTSCACVLRLLTVYANSSTGVLLSGRLWRRRRRCTDFFIEVQRSVQKVQNCG
jgi:hypothetical protein